MTTELNEATAPVVTPTPVLEDVAGKRLRVRGVFQKVGQTNENNRSYPASVWDSNLGVDSSLMKRLESRSVLGELEHPEAGVTHLGRVSHLIESVWRKDLQEGNEYGVPPGDYIVGEALIFNTPAGQILRELYSAGVPVGISSRGRGDVQADAEGVDIVQDNYQVDTWDFVYQPSVIEATPHPVIDDSKKKSASNSDVTLLEFQSVMARGELSELVEVHARLKRAQEYNTHEIALTGCLTTLSEAIRLKEGITSSPTVKSESTSGRRKQTMSNERTALLLERMVVRTVRAETVKNASPPNEVSSVRRTRTKDEGADSRGSKRYAALMQVSDGLLKRAKDEKERREAAEEKLQKKSTRYDAAVALAHRLQQKTLEAVGELTKLKARGKDSSRALPSKRAPAERSETVTKVRNPAGSRLMEDAPPESKREVTLVSGVVTRMNLDETSQK